MNTTTLLRDFGHIQDIPHDKIFVLVDEHTRMYCLPILLQALSVPNEHIICIPATDEHKDISSLTTVWTTLSQQGATRQSLLVNLGGGMVTDLGGFAAATFKRGISFVNIPTTLLAMVDAAAGGKTGINLGGLKNEVGAFAPAEGIVIHTPFLRTLDRENILSGYAEMLKHALLHNEEMLTRHLTLDLDTLDEHTLETLIHESMEVKAAIVASDLHEQGPRKALNLGHTTGHALESLALEKHTPILHGYAVAWGLVGALYLSTTRLHFPRQTMYQVVQFVKEYYGTPGITCKDYDRFCALMQHDKKNDADHIRFTLLNGVGDIRINQAMSHDDILEMLDYLRENL